MPVVSASGPCVKVTVASSKVALCCTIYILAPHARMQLLPDCASAASWQPGLVNPGITMTAAAFKQEGYSPIWLPAPSQYRSYSTNVEQGVAASDASGAASDGSGGQGNVDTTHREHDGPSDHLASAPGSNPELGDEHAEGGVTSGLEALAAGRVQELSDAARAMLQADMEAALLAFVSQHGSS